MKYVLNYLFFYILQVENGAAEMGEIVCRLCNERFSSKKERKTHTVNCRKIQKCSSCNVSVSEFNNLRSFNVHRRNCENGQLRCPHCGRNNFKKKGGRSADKLLNDHYSKCKKKRYLATNAINVYLIWLNWLNISRVVTHISIVKYAVHIVKQKKH